MSVPLLRYRFVVDRAPPLDGTLESLDLFVDGGAVDVCVELVWIGDRFIEGKFTDPMFAHGVHHPVSDHVDLVGGPRPGEIVCGGGIPLLRGFPRSSGMSTIRWFRRRSVRTRSAVWQKCPSREDPVRERLGVLSFEFVVEVHDAEDSLLTLPVQLLSQGQHIGAG